MWIMAPGGILMPSIRPTETIEAGDVRTLQVRARVRSHLDRFRTDYCGAESAGMVDGGMGPTIASPSMDYQYRAYVSVADLQAGVAAMIADINYLKFKPSTETFYGDGALHTAYTRIWGSVLGAFPQPKSVFGGLSTDADLEKLAPKGAYRLPISTPRKVSRPKVGTTTVYNNGSSIFEPPPGVSYRDDDEAFEAWLRSHSAPTQATERRSVAEAQAEVDRLLDEREDEAFRSHLEAAADVEAEAEMIELDALEDFVDDDEFLDEMVEAECQVAGTSLLTQYASVIRAAIAAEQRRLGVTVSPSTPVELDPAVTVSEREGLPI